MLARRLLSTVLLAGTVAAVAASAPPAGASNSASAQTLYRDAIATTHSWSVHYTSISTQSKVTLRISGDAGPASGSQSVAMGTGSISILVIGDITYLKGNTGGLQSLAGLSASQAAKAAGQWIEFATTNSVFAPVVAGVRSHDVAQELALRGPLSLGRHGKVGHQAVDAIKGTQTLGRHKVDVVLYVRAHGRHVPVEEVSVNAKGRPIPTVHVRYSKWGERVRPRAPRATISIGSISTV